MWSHETIKAPSRAPENPKEQDLAKFGNDPKIIEGIKLLQWTEKGKVFLEENEDKILSLLSDFDIAWALELINDWVLETKDISIATKPITLIDDTKISQEKTEANQGRAEANQGKLENKLSEKERSNEAYDKLSATIDNIYSVFGGKEGFKKTFGDNYQTWENTAKKDIGELKKDATESEKKEYESRVQAHIVLNNQEVILQKTPEDKKQELQALFWELRSSARTLEIPYPSSLSKEPVANSTCETIIKELGISRTDAITRQGSLLIADKKDADGKDIRIAVDISKIPPERVVVGNSLRASAASEENILQKHEEKILDLQLQKDTQKNLFDSKKEIFKWSNINSVFPGLENLSRNVDITDIDSVVTLGREFDTMANKKLTEETKAGINDSDKAILNQAIKTIQDSIKSMVEASWRFYAIGRQISEEQRILERESSKPKDSKESRDSIARENIAFFESIGLSEFGQDDFQDFLKKFNGTNAGFEVDPKTITIKNKGWDPADGEYWRGVEEKDKRSIIENLIKKLPDNKKIGDFVKCDAEWVITPPLTLKSNPETGKTLLQETLRTLKLNEKTLNTNPPKESSESH